MNKFKSYEHDTTVTDILSEYIVCSKDKIIQCLVGDSDENMHCLLEYWAEVNRTNPLSILDAIELSLLNIANFSVIGQQNNTLYSVLKLPNDINIPLAWDLH